MPANTSAQVMVGATGQYGSLACAFLLLNGLVTARSQTSLSLCMPPCSNARQPMSTSCVLHALIQIGTHFCLGDFFSQEGLNWTWTSEGAALHVDGFACSVDRSDSCQKLLCWFLSGEFFQDVQMRQRNGVVSFLLSVSVLCFLPLHRHVSIPIRQSTDCNQSFTCENRLATEICRD